MNQNLYSVNLQQLEIFVYVVENGSFTKAASIIHITQSAVSKNIEKLEQRLDLQLFTRDHKNLYLTEAGRELYQAVKACLQQLSDSYDIIWPLQHEQKKNLHVGIVNNTDLERYFWPVWTGFQHRFPEVITEFESDALSVMTDRLIAKEFELIFVPDFMAEKLEQEHLSWKWMSKKNAVVVLPKGHPLEKKPITFEALKEEKIVLLSDENTNNVHYMEKLFAARGYRLKVGKLFSSPDNICRFYKSSDGILVTDVFFDCSKIHEKVVRRTWKEVYAGIIVAWNPKVDNDYVRKFLKSIPE